MSLPLLNRLFTARSSLSWVPTARVVPIAIVGALLASGLGISVSYAVGDCSAQTIFDVNGDGFGDVVAGAPLATIGTAAKAGEIAVHFGTANDPPDTGPSGATDLITIANAVTGAAPAPGDQFGAQIALGRVDSDECTDAVVSVPGATVDGRVGAGEVVILFGSPSGLGQGRASIVITADQAGLGSVATAGAHFGSALALTDDDRESNQVTHLAIGIPSMAVAGYAGAGGVALLDFALDGDGSVQAARTITQSSAGVVGASETGDHFGSALAFGWAGDACQSNWCRELIVGVPGENAGAGAMVVIDGTSTAGAYTSSAWSQNSPGVAGAAEAGDGFGSAISWSRNGATGSRYLAVGVPGEDIGSIKDAGSVELFRYPSTMTSAGSESISQDTKGVSGAAEAGDRFGSALLATELHTDAFVEGLAVGVPGEDLGTVVDAGEVALFFMDTTDPGYADASVSQSSAGVPGTAQAGERFGSSLSSIGSLESLLVGVPKDVGYPGGVVESIPWTTITRLGPTEEGAVWHPLTSGEFGASIGPEF